MAGKPAAACSAAICAAVCGCIRSLDHDRLHFTGDFGQDERVVGIDHQLVPERPKARCVADEQAALVDKEIVGVDVPRIDLRVPEGERARRCLLATESQFLEARRGVGHDYVDVRGIFTAFVAAAHDEHGGNEAARGNET